MRRTIHPRPAIRFVPEGFSFMGLALLLCLGLTPAEGLSQVSVLPGFTVEVLATTEQQPTSLAFAPAGSPFGSDLFVGTAVWDQGATGIDDRILRISPTGTVTLFAPLLPEADLEALEFPPSGSPWGEFLYVSANNRDNGRPGDCGGAIQRVDASGNVIDFTSLGPFPPFPGAGCLSETAMSEPAGFAFGPGGAFGMDLFVANSSDVPADIMRVDPSGIATSFVNDGKFSADS